VSETISFVLVFGLVVASVGTVYAIGVSDLEATRDAERVENAQRAFDVLADNVDDLRKGAPSRGTEVKLAESTLRSTDDARMNVTVTSGNTQVFPQESSEGSPVRLRPLVYDVQAGGEIRLSNGAVIRDSGAGGATVVRGPPLVVDDDRVHITMLKGEHVGSAAIGGDRTVRVRTEVGRTEVRYHNESVANGTVHVNLTTPYPEAWARHYKSVGFTCPELATPMPDASGEVSCHVNNVDRVTVVRLRMVTTFE
jgi:hypothetical protein